MQGVVQLFVGLPKFAVVNCIDIGVHGSIVLEQNSCTLHALFVNKRVIHRPRLDASPAQTCVQAPAQHYPICHR